MATSLSDLHTDKSCHDLRELRKQLKWEGYGLYWALMERLVSETTHILDTDYNTLAWDLRADAGVVKQIICDFGLFTLTADGSGFYSEKIMQRCKAADELKKARSEAGKKGARKRWKQSDDSTPIASATEMDSKAVASATESDGAPMANAKQSMANAIESDGKPIASAIISDNKPIGGKEKEVQQEKETNNTLLSREEVINNNIKNLNLLKKESVRERKHSLTVVDDADGGEYHLEESTKAVLDRLLEVFQKRDPKRLDIRPIELQALMKLRADIGTSDADEQIISVLDQFDVLPLFQQGGKFQGWNMLTLLKYKNFDMIKSGMFNAPQRQDNATIKGFGTMHTKVEKPIDDIPF